MDSALTTIDLEFARRLTNFFGVLTPEFYFYLTTFLNGSIGLDNFPLFYLAVIILW
jgi:hypothetical protein